MGENNQLWAQINQEFANQVIFQEGVSNAPNAVDGQLDTFARLSSNSGLALGIGARTGIIEIEFPSILPANTTTFIKLDFDIEVLEALLGGRESGLGSSLLQNQIFGNHTLEIQAKNSNQIILSGNTGTPTDFAGDDLRVVVDENGDYYISIRPDLPYRSIRIIDRTSALLGLGVENTTEIFGAFIITPNHECIKPVFTGVNLQNFNLSNLLGTQPVINPENILDGDPETFSILNFTAINQDASMEQFVLLSELSAERSTFSLRFRFDTDNIGTPDLQNISINGFENSNLVFEQDLADLVSTENIQKLQNGEFINIDFEVDNQINRIAVLLCRNTDGATSLPSLQLALIEKTIAEPIIPQELLEIEICKGESVTLTANASENLLLRWYDSLNAEVPLAELPENANFISQEIFENQTFYVASFDPVCLKESDRLPMVIRLLPAIEDLEIVVSGNEEAICPSDTLILTPRLNSESGFEEGQLRFRWYLDADLETEILDNQQILETLFRIDEQGVLTVSNLNADNFISTFYLVTEFENSCGNSPSPIPVSIMMAENCQNYKLEKSVDRETAKSGEIVTFTITVTNEGSRELNNLEIKDILAPGFIFVTSSSNVKLSSNNTVTWSIPNLPPQEIIELTITVRLVEGLPTGSIISNLATGKLLDENENNQTSNTVNVLVINDDDPILEIEKIVNKSEAAIGELITYTITVKNIGNGIASNLVVADPVPANTLFVSADNNGTLTSGTVLWSIQTLSPEETLELTLIVEILEDAVPESIIRNQASITSVEIPSPVLSEIVETIVIIKEQENSETTVSISKILSNNDEVFIGSIIDFEIMITNAGDVVAENLLVEDILPNYLLPISANSSSQIDGQTVSWTFPSLASGGNLILNISAMVQENAQVIINTASVSGANFEEKTAQSIPVQVQESDLDADLNILLDKSLEKTSVQVGEVFRYSLTITNQGENEIIERRIIVSDTLPAEVGFVGIINQGTAAEYNSEFGVLIWEISTLAVGESKTLVFEVEALIPSLNVINQAYLAIEKNEGIEVVQVANTVHEQLDYKVSNVITPNGDGKNDTWQTQGLGGFLETWEVIIFNRYGIELFRGSNYVDGWSGDGLNPGTYFYQIQGKKINGSDFLVSGYITLIK